MNNKKLIEINRCDNASTGTIANDILTFSRQQGYRVGLVVYKNNQHYDYSYSIPISNESYRINRLFSKFEGSDGFNNKISTEKMVRYLNSFAPSIIHLHILHGQYLNLPVLFNYLSECRAQIIWTFHDCWGITGRCAHFDAAMCDKWKTGCGHCPHKNIYPQSLCLDRSRFFYHEKEQLFTKIQDRLTIVAPSLWMKNQVSESFLNTIDCRVINNGIFPASLVSDAEKEEQISKYRLEGKKVFFSAAYPFSENKGITFISLLADNLDPKRYAFLIAGLSENERGRLSKNLILLGKVSSRHQMDILYSLSTAFVNPTLEDTFPTVDIEALSNGTPVVTFETGGSSEIVDRQTGILVPKRDFATLLLAVKAIEKSPSTQEQCVSRSRSFSKLKMVNSYFELFEEKGKNKDSQ